MGASRFMLRRGKRLRAAIHIIYKACRSLSATLRPSAPGVRGLRRRPSVRRPPFGATPAPALPWITAVSRGKSCAESALPAIAAKNAACPPSERQAKRGQAMERVRKTPARPRFMPRGAALCGRRSPTVGAYGGACAHPSAPAPANARKSVDGSAKGASHPRCAGQSTPK